MNELKKTLVLGASGNPSRYSHLAIHRLVSYGHPVYAIGKKPAIVAGITVETEKIFPGNIHTVTLYLNPQHQKEYYDYILSLKPKRIIFNPGAENEELAFLSEQKGILTMDACTLVLLSTGQY
jgi:predicted CoA-binding protein